MKYRVLIFDDNDTIRSVLYQFIDGLGYEVFTFTDPSLCPFKKRKFVIALIKVPVQTLLFPT